MKITITMITGLLLIAVLTTSYWNANYNDEPSEVVKRYCRLSIEGEFEKISEITTFIPEEYWNGRVKESDFSKNSLEEQKEIDNSKSLKSEKLELSFSSRELDTLNLKIVTNDTPRLMFKNGEYIKHIDQSWTKENQSRVQVTMGSNISEKYVSKKDFFLFKIDNKWKIFKVSGHSTTNWGK